MWIINTARNTSVCTFLIFAILRGSTLCSVLLVGYDICVPQVKTSSYPGWIKSPHVVTLGILKLSDLDSLTIFNLGGYSGVNFGHPKSEVFRNGGGIPE